MRTLTAAATVVLAAAFVGPGVQTAHATPTQTAEACSVWAGSVTASGGHYSSTVKATNPPSMSTPGGQEGIFPPGEVRLSSTFTNEPSTGTDINSGLVVRGDSLYARYYGDGGDDSTRIGGGWATFTALELSEYDEGQDGVRRSSAYGLRGDGVLFRWTPGKTWKATGSASGFASVKSMALISKTRTYDTFLANTRGGALYTIHIPTSAPMKPVVKQVRSGTWQGFETLIASKCGNYGTVLLGIDKDTKTGNLYAVGHANGASTVINGLGKVNGTFPDAVNFRWTATAPYDQLNGE